MNNGFFNLLPIRHTLFESIQAYRQYSLALRQKEDPQDMFVAVDGLQLLSQQIALVRPAWVGQLSNRLYYWIVGRYVVSWMCPEAGKSLSVWKHSIQKIDVGMDFGTKMVAPFLRVATIVTSITLVYFGFWLNGGLGATAWLLQELKRQKQLPYFLDEQLGKIEIVGDLFRVISPGSWLLRKNSLSRCFNFFSQSAAYNNFVGRWCPWLQNPFLGRHIWDPIQCALSKGYLDSDLVNWQVNLTHIHAKEVGQVWPVEREHIDLKDVIQDFENWMEQVPESPKGGFRSIKEIVTSQNTDREYPENREEFVLFLKNALHTKHASLAKLTGDDFKKEFKIFLEQIDINTKQPTTTWMAAFSEIIQPHSKDIAWEVHASLSRFREVCLDDALETYNKEIQEDVQKRNLGGLESTFLAQRAPSHICMRHLFRTRLGEITSKMSYHSPKQMFFIKHILDGIGTGQEKFSAFYENVNTIFVGILYTLNCPKYSMIAAEPIIKDTWGEISDVSKTVTYVYENIKKEQISAIALAEWETDFCKRNSLLNREHFKSLYKEARSTNPSNKQEWHLNKKGVVLLLSDLSVLKYNR